MQKTKFLAHFPLGKQAIARALSVRPSVRPSVPRTTFFEDNFFWIFFSVSYFCHPKDALKFWKKPLHLKILPFKVPSTYKEILFSVLFLCFWLQWCEIWHVSALRYYKWKQSKFLEKFKCQMSVKIFLV